MEEIVYCRQDWKRDVIFQRRVGCDGWPLLVQHVDIFLALVHPLDGDGSGFMPSLFWRWLMHILYMCNSIKGQIPGPDGEWEGKFSTLEYSNLILVFLSRMVFSMLSSSGSVNAKILLGTN